MNNPYPHYSNPDRQPKTNSTSQSMGKGQIDKANHTAAPKEEPCSSREANSVERITPNAGDIHSGMLGEG